jgi:lipopolysaccharide/colanic/teichoic acid biosynthesis glycosyltransferase
LSTPGYPGKRILDIALCLATAPLWAPVYAACAALIRVDSKGPVLFRQERVGFGGKPFRIYKFRSMVDEPLGNPVFPERGRITRVGGVLRRLSLDEIPQVFNVLKGDMSLVGPRPTLAYQVERYDDRQRRRLAVRPGITGLAQVRGRNSISWSDRIDLDLEYVNRQSMGLDVRILLATPLAVLSARGLDGHITDDPLASTAATSPKS